MDSTDYDDLFFRSVPEQFMRRCIRMLFEAHSRAWDTMASDFSPTEAENLRGFYRRAVVEGSIRDVADLHVEDGVSHRVVKAEGSGWNHTEILAGPVLLTAGSVQRPCGPVNKADFRFGLAASNQGSFFETGPLGPNLYVMLLHSRYKSVDPGKQRRFGHLPGSAYLAFPANDLDSYVHEVNLFDRYPDIVSSNLPQEWDQEAVVRYMHDARKTSWPRSA